MSSDGNPPPRVPDPPDSRLLRQQRQLAMVSRLLLLVPLTAGTLITLVVFTARGGDGRTIATIAAGIGFALLWGGLAWALRSATALLITFVPAALTITGALMVGGPAQFAAVTLMVLGLTLAAAPTWMRLMRPTRHWSGPLRADPASPSMEEPSYDVSVGTPDLGDDQLPVPAPDWDTSATDRRARDAFVLALCGRGATTGPTLATLEEFFTGNGDPRSIAPGLRGELPLSLFATVLFELRARRDVADVQVQLEPLGAGEFPIGAWPVADGLHVTGAIPADALAAVLAPLRAEEPIGPLPTDDGHDEYAIWWA